MTERDQLATQVALGVLAAFAVPAALVGVRGELASEVVVLVLALVVVVLGRTLSRAGAVAGALMAAASYDFFFTRPYLSLKMDDSRDIGVTLALLLVGLVAGGISSRAHRDHLLARDNAIDNDTIRRLLDVAGEHSSEDVELAVRAELLKLLDLSECTFTTHPVTVPTLGATGALPRTTLVHRRDGFQLPQEGIAIAAVPLDALPEPDDDIATIGTLTDLPAVVDPFEIVGLRPDEIPAGIELRDVDVGVAGGAARIADEDEVLVPGGDDPTVLRGENHVGSAPLGIGVAEGRLELIELGTRDSGAQGEPRCDRACGRGEPLPCMVELHLSLRMMRLE